MFVFNLFDEGDETTKGRKSRTKRLYPVCLCVWVFFLKRVLSFVVGCCFRGKSRVYYCISAVCIFCICDSAAAAAIVVLFFFITAVQQTLNVRFRVCLVSSLVCSSPLLCYTTPTGPAREL